MRFIYENTDITDLVQIQDVTIDNRATGSMDSLELVMSDTDELWSKWNPKKGDIVYVLSNEGFSSGEMYIDEWDKESGSFTLRAISGPLTMKTEKTRSWNKIRLKEIFNDIASNHGLVLKMYNINDYLYDRVDQINETDLMFLNRLCIREGYCLKVNDGTIIIYNERQLEAEESVIDITSSNVLGKPIFSSTAEGIRNSCIIKYTDTEGNFIKHQFFAPESKFGGDLKSIERVNNEAEAERYSRSYLRNQNKFEDTGVVVVKLNKGIDAGNTVSVIGYGIADGKYIIYRAVHSLKNEKMILYIRRTLEGY